jgi:hypothetical protein
VSGPYRRNRGFLRPPTATELEALAALDGIELRPDEAAGLPPSVAALVDAASLFIRTSTSKGRQVDLSAVRLSG